MGEVNPTASCSADFAATPGLIIRHWPGESSVVVFTPADRKTHLISPLAATILQMSGSGTNSRTLLSELSEVDAFIEPATAEEHLQDGPCLPQEESQQVLSEAIRGLLQAGLLRPLE